MTPNNEEWGPFRQNDREKIFILPRQIGAYIRNPSRNFLTITNTEDQQRSVKSCRAAEITKPRARQNSDLKLNEFLRPFDAHELRKNKDLRTDF